MKIDLHIHSTCSDGADNWETILQRAEKTGLDYISVTDHDNCDVYGKIKNPLKYFKGKIVTGIEMQAQVNGVSVELLGYGFSVEKMQTAIKGLHLPFNAVNSFELESLYSRFTALGVKLPAGIMEKYDAEKCFYATLFLHNEMKKFPENKAFFPDEESWLHEHIFYKRHMSNPVSPFFVDMSAVLPSAQNTADLIRNAGGKVFIPHIFQYEENAEKILNALLENCKLDGIECYYPSFTAKQTQFLLDLCKQRNLLVSGGSDWHGSNRQKVDFEVEIKESQLSWLKQICI